MGKPSLKDSIFRFYPESLFSFVSRLPGGQSDSFLLVVSLGDGTHLEEKRTRLIVKKKCSVVECRGLILIRLELFKNA